MPEKEKDYLKKLNRLLIWPTLILLIILVISGYGIVNSATVSQLTWGLFSHSISLYLHNALILPTLTLVLIHVLIAIRSTLTRWGVKDERLLNAFLISLGTFVLVSMVLLQYLVV